MTTAVPTWITDLISAGDLGDSSDEKIDPLSLLSAYQFLHALDAMGQPMEFSIGRTDESREIKIFSDNWVVVFNKDGTFEATSASE